MIFDLVMVFPSPKHMLLVLELPKQFKRQLLIRHLLRVIKGGVEITSLGVGEMLVPALIKHISGDGNCFVVRGIGLRCSAEDVPGDLVKISAKAPSPDSTWAQSSYWPSLAAS